MEENLEQLERGGYFILPEVFRENEVAILREKIDQVWERQLEEYGSPLLDKLGEYGAVRAMMAYDDYFLTIIMNETINSYVEAIIGKSAIMHLQNGIIVFPDRKHNQGKFHKDFPKSFIASRLLSVNFFIAVDLCDETSGATWFVPGSHKFEKMPSHEYMKRT